VGTAKCAFDEANDDGCGTGELLAGVELDGFPRCAEGVDGELVLGLPRGTVGLAPFFALAPVWGGTETGDDRLHDGPGQCLRLLRRARRAR
jgi:hypothetical protein